MDYKEKYEQAISRMNKWVEGSEIMDPKEVAEFVFPELKESNDERIRKWLIDDVKDTISSGHMPKEYEYMAKNAISWLEKQGEKKLTIPIWKYKKDHTPLLRDSFILNKYGCVANSPSGALVSDVWVLDFDELAKLPKEEFERQSEQKPTDKVEPKFKVGDWIIGNKQINCTNYIMRINKVGLTDYQCQYNNGLATYHFDFVDKNYHLWTIQDAKDGDVLAYENDIVIFKENNYNPEDKSGCMFVYCSCNNFYEIGGINPTYYKPATKEQRELLFQKMKEAGYEWDAEKKELKKIGQEEDAELTDFESALFSAFSDAWQEYLRGEEVNVAKWAREHSAELLEVVREQKPEPKQEWKQENTGDLTDFENAMMHIGGSFFGDNAGLDPNDTNAIKEQANILLGLVQKQEWSEEDEKYFNVIYKELESYIAIKGYYTPLSCADLNWLKSLKDRYTWKPSDEQMTALRRMKAAIAGEGEIYGPLDSLYEDLKKLKGE